VYFKYGRVLAETLPV